MNISNNPLRRTALVWTGIIVLGIIVIFIPGIIGLDGFDGGFALWLLGGLIAITGIVAAIIYNGLANTLDGILKEENLLARWTYSPEEWQTYTEKEHAEDNAARKGLFLLIAVISVIVGVMLWIVKRDNPLVILFTILGIIAVVGLTAYLTASSNYRRNRKYLGEAYITRDGVYLNRQLHIWKGIGTHLNEVVYEDANRSQPIIRFEYCAPGIQGRAYVPYFYTARVPVPRGEEEKAKQIVAEISTAHISPKAT